MTSLHVTAPGPAGIASTLLSRITGLPLLGSYHTELATYAGLRAAIAMLEAVAETALGAFYSVPSVRVLSPSPAADGSLARARHRGAAVRALGARRATPLRFDPAKAERDGYPGELKSPLRRAPLPREGSRPARRELPPRPRAPTPACTCCWPAAAPRRGSCGPGLAIAADLPGLARWRGAGRRLRERRRLPLLQRQTDTYGQVILEAGASGLPVIAIAEGGPAALVENRHTGLLCRPDRRPYCRPACSSLPLSPRCADASAQPQFAPPAHAPGSAR